jgi:hypothetical protein
MTRIQSATTIFTIAAALMGASGRLKAQVPLDTTTPKVVTNIEPKDVQAEIASETVRDDVFPKTSAHFADGIVGQPDVEYSNIVGFRPLQLDLYTHERSGTQARPLVIWIHGGGWRRGDSRTSAAYADFPDGWPHGADCRQATYRKCNPGESTLTRISSMARKGLAIQAARLWQELQF